MNGRESIEFFLIYENLSLAKKWQACVKKIFTMSNKDLLLIYWPFRGILSTES
jgi:hypothetical protein